MSFAQNKRFEFLPHTADAKFRAYGRTLEEAVANAALAMASLMWDFEQVELEVREKVEIRATSLESLMVKFLTEVLYLFEVKRFLLGKVEEVRLKLPSGEESEEKAGEAMAGEYWLQATLAGDTYSEKYEIISEVKAATYNDFKLERREDGVMLQMVVDM